MNLSEKSDIIAAVLGNVVNDDIDSAGALLRKHSSPSSQTTPEKRKSTAERTLQIARRDGFIDRYSGQKLVYPAALKLIARKLEGTEWQKDFFYHPHWKMPEAQSAWWYQLYPTLDHIEPIAGGGSDDDNNIVLTSQSRNTKKSDSTLEKLDDWKLHDKGNLSNWDGLMGMTTRYLEEHPDLLEDPYLKRWHTAQCKVFPPTG